MPASLVRQYVGNDIWQSYYKFCFERNPWDKVVSLYFWRNKSENRIDFSDYIDECKIKGRNLSEYKLYTLDNKLAVDDVYKFEEIEMAMKAIAEKLKLPEVPQLPKTKTDTNKKKSHYRDMYNENTREYVAESFSHEIELLNYKF